MLLEVITFCLILIVSIYYFITRRYFYWEKQGIPSVPGEFPFGSVKNCIYLKETIGETLAKFYRDYKGSKIVGFYGPFEPLLLIRDPELIKTVLVKEFNSFHDNGFELAKDIDPLLGNNPFGIKGLQEWKQVRSIHTPLQTIVKIKNTIPFIKTVADNLIKYISENGKQIEMKETTRFYTLDVVANCFFGIESDSFFNNDSPLKVYTNGELFGNAANKACLSAFFLPMLNKIFGWRTMSSSAETFFIDMVNTCIEHRIQSGQNRNDLIQHLMSINEKCEQEKLKALTPVELAAHCTTVFIDGVETTSIALTFTLFELAANEDVQIKLRNEIKSAVQELGDVDFDKLWSLPYLDMVVSEALRKYAPVNLLSRLCTQDTQLDGFKIKKGTKVFIPVHGLHMDPEFYPQPEKFIPERFSKENRQLINKMVYLPFGEGPRVCLGFRFAQTEIKMALVALLLKFQLSLPKENQKKTMPLDENCIFLIAPKGDVNIIFEKI